MVPHRRGAIAALLALVAALLTVSAAHAISGVATTRAVTCRYPGISARGYSTAATVRIGSDVFASARWG